MLTTILLGIANKTGLSALVVKLIALGLLLAALIGGYALWHHHVWKSGYTAAVTAIAAQDQGAINAVNAAKSTVDDCYRRHGTWNTVDGMCSE